MLAASAVNSGNWNSETTESFESLAVLIYIGRAK